MAEITLTEALSKRRTIRRFSKARVPLAALERLVWAAQGVTAPDGRRTAPSAHALHPLRLLVLARRIEGLGQGRYEVDPSSLALDLTTPADPLPALRRAAIGDPEWITDAACVVAICADTAVPTDAFADQKPYGLRGTRYLYLEAGAAAQNLHLQAVAEGLGIVWVGGLDDEAAAEVLGLETPVAPILLLCVGYPA